MSRIHPNGSEATRRAAERSGSGSSRPPTAAAAAAASYYTVWKRSSMGFQGTDGFSVYDAAGELAFRLDNYSRRPKLFAGDLTLMDGRGAPLLSLTPQIISIHDQWNCYKPPEEGQGKRTRPQQLFSVRKCSVLQSTREAEVYMPSSGCANASSAPPSSSAASDHQTGHGQAPSFWVEGCFSKRSCKFCRGGDGEEVARIARKKAGASAPNKTPLTLGEDVFSLVVQPNVDCAMIMAFVVVLDRICWRPYTPLMCRSSS